jgi:hypothetical protein
LSPLPQQLPGKFSVYRLDVLLVHSSPSTTTTAAFTSTFLVHRFANQSLYFLLLGRWHKPTRHQVPHFWATKAATIAFCLDFFFAWCQILFSEFSSGQSKRTRGIRRRKEDKTQKLRAQHNWCQRHNNQSGTIGQRFVQRKCGALVEKGVPRSGDSILVSILPGSRNWRRHLDHSRGNTVEGSFTAVGSSLSGDDGGTMSEDDVLRQQNKLNTTFHRVRRTSC